MSPPPLLSGTKAGGAITSQSLGTAEGARFCSESCFAQSRRASFKRAKTCDWCRHIRHAVSYVDFQDGASQLQFCSEKCLNQYKMQIFIKETQAHLEMNPHLRDKGSTSGNNWITPELWLRNCKSRSVSPAVSETTTTRSRSVSPERVRRPESRPPEEGVRPTISVAPASKLLTHPPPLKPPLPPPTPAPPTSLPSIQSPTPMDGRPSMKSMRKRKSIRNSPPMRDDFPINRMTNAMPVSGGLLISSSSNRGHTGPAPNRVFNAGRSDPPKQASDSMGMPRQCRTTPPPNLFSARTNRPTMPLPHNFRVPGLHVPPNAAESHASRNNPMAGAFQLGSAMPFLSNQVPPVTVLVPCPILVPVPIPIPIPIALPDFLKCLLAATAASAAAAASTTTTTTTTKDSISKGKKEEAAVTADGSHLTKERMSTDEGGSGDLNNNCESHAEYPLDCSSKTVRVLSSRASSGQHVSASSEDEAEERGGGEQPGTQTVNPTTNTTPHIPILKITRLQTKKRILTAKELDSSRPLRKRKRIVVDTP